VKRLQKANTPGWQGLPVTKNLTDQSITICPDFQFKDICIIIKTIVREYSTNAKDSQVEAGVTKPFDVQLPSVNNPMFKIRDYCRHNQPF